MQNSWFSVLSQHVLWWLDIIVSEDRAASIFRIANSSSE